MAPEPVQRSAATPSSGNSSMARVYERLRLPAGYVDPAMDPDLAAGEIDVPVTQANGSPPTRRATSRSSTLLVAPSGLYQLVGLLLRGDAPGGVEPERKRVPVERAGVHLRHASHGPVSSCSQPRQELTSPVK